MLQAGDVIAGRYRLLAPLAEGGMGAVWRAEHTELNVEVALKVLLERVATPDGEKRFRREAQAAAKLRSVHVVNVHDFGIFDGQPYLAMELLHGEDLEQRLERDGPLPLPACATVLDALAKAVQLAHDNGIVHRDLKPANVFLARDGDGEVVKVLDFGIAKVEGGDAKNTTGAGLMGSPAYMSPEQVWSEKLDYTTDIWSLGVIAFEIVTGKNPFEGGALAKVFQRIVSEPLPRPSDFRQGLPAGMDTFFQQALERVPAARFPSAQALAIAFRAATAGAGEDVALAQTRELEGGALTVPARSTAARAIDPHARTLDLAPAGLAPKPQGSLVKKLALGVAGIGFLAAGTLVFVRAFVADPQGEGATVVSATEGVAIATASSSALVTTSLPNTPPSASATVSAGPSPVASASAPVLRPSAGPKLVGSAARQTQPPATAASSSTLPALDPDFGIPRKR